MWSHTALNINIWFIKSLGKRVCHFSFLICFCLFETYLEDYRIVLLLTKVGHRVERILRGLKLNVTSVRGANHSRETFHLLESFHYFICPCTWELYIICFREILLFLHNFSKGWVIRSPSRFHNWHIFFVISFRFYLGFLKGGGVP